MNRSPQGDSAHAKSFYQGAPLKNWLKGMKKVLGVLGHDLLGCTLQASTEQSTPTHLGPVYKELSFILVTMKNRPA